MFNRIMIQKNNYFHSLILILMFVIVPLMADQPSSSNYTMIQNAFTTGAPNQAVLPGSAGFQLVEQSLGGISEDEIGSPLYGHFPGFLVPYLIYGCTDPAAFNYNPNANIDDGSCIECMPGDMNGVDGVDVSDIVLIVAVILGSIPTSDFYMCAGDVNGDGELNVVDLVEVVDMILNPGLRCGPSLSSLTLKLGNHHMLLTADGTIAGIQLFISGEYQLDGRYLPPGWQVSCSQNMILVYDLKNQNPVDRLTLSWTGDLSIHSGIAADWYGNEVPVDIGELPQTFSLSAPWPNPFNPSTTIQYKLPEDTAVRITIHDICGREIAELVDEYQSAGVYIIRWEAGIQANGIYILRMVSGDYTATRKVIYIK